MHKENKYNANTSPKLVKRYERTRRIATIIGGLQSEDSSCTKKERKD